MSNSPQQRVDEVSKYYRPVESIGSVCTWLFWIIAALSLLMPYTTTVGIPASIQSLPKVIFIVLVTLRFALSQISSRYLVPKSEQMRRKQLLSDAFGTPLSHDETSLYYNNQYSPSVQRLGANTLENALFSKEITARMLQTKRFVVGGYAVAWLLAFTLRHNNLELLTWITQLVFSAEIVDQWLKMEVLRSKCEQTFDQLHAHFLHGIGESSAAAVATILDAFIMYESAKSSAGIKLSTKIFQKLNPTLSKEWEKIRRDLGMD
jgi:hypothetical protein